jgi:hypothetical protein
VVFRHRALDPAEFTYTRQLLDLPPGGNGDGRLQGGETVTLRVQVRNTGKGAAGESYLRLKNESGEAVDVKKGIFDLTGLKPGAVATYDLQFKVSSRPGVSLAKLQLSVGDCEIGPSVSEKLRLAVVGAEGALAVLKGVAVPKAVRTEVFQSAVTDHVLGHSAAGARFAVTGRIALAGAALLRVALPGGGSGFVREAEVTLLRGGAAAPRLDWRWLPDRPTLTTDPVPDVVAGPTMTLKGEARDAERVSDVYVSVRRILRSPDQSRLIGTDFNKVYYQATRSLTAKQLAFTADVPLWPGSNLVTIVVRKNDEIKTRRTFRVLRTTCGSAAAVRAR